LLLGEASHGNLQAFINTNNSSIKLSQRKKWCHQSAEAVAFIHSRGVIHSDLRPENFLVHETAPGCLDLLLCDFGGAVCEELGLDGNQLPNDPFYDPTQGSEITTNLDIFSLGSIFYTILIGYWPYRTRTFFSEGDDYLDYVDKVNLLFRQGRFPDVDGLWGGSVMMACWRKELIYNGRADSGSLGYANANGWRPGGYTVMRQGSKNQPLSIESRPSGQRPNVADI
jgi:serine/threonine protein kinase